MELYIKSFISLIVIIVILCLPIIFRRFFNRNILFVDDKNKKVSLKQVSYIDKKTKLVLIEYNNSTSLILVGESFCSVIEKMQGHDERV